MARHLRLIEQAKAALSIPVIGSLNATHPGAWQRYAREMADAGADALELNLYTVAADPSVDAAGSSRPTWTRSRPWPRPSTSRWR